MTLIGSIGTDTNLVAFGYFPEKVVTNHSAEYGEQVALRRAAPLLLYGNTKPVTLTLSEALIEGDNTEALLSNLVSYTLPAATEALISPPLIRLNLGDRIFLRGYLTELVISRTHFNPAGEAIQAMVDLTVVEQGSIEPLVVRTARETDEITRPLRPREVLERGLDPDKLWQIDQDDNVTEVTS